MEFYEYLYNNVKPRKYDKIVYCQTSTSYYDLMRFVQMFSMICLFFVLHLNINEMPINIILNLTFILIITIVKLDKMLIRLSSIIILWCFLLSPIILTLTREVDNDTIYMYWFLLNLFYTVDLCKNDILNETFNDYKFEKQKNIYKNCRNRIHSEAKHQVKNKIDSILKTKKKTFDNKHDDIHIKSKVLTLEDTYMNSKPINRPTFGYNCNILGSILLSSRYNHFYQVFFVLCFNLIFFIGFPNFTTPFFLHKNNIFSTILIFITLILTYHANLLLFIGYSIVTFSIIIIGFSIIYITNHYIKCKII